MVKQYGCGLTWAEVGVQPKVPVGSGGPELMKNDPGAATGAFEVMVTV